jgi:hypothetical protein
VTQPLPTTAPAPAAPGAAAGPVGAAADDHVVVRASLAVGAVLSLVAGVVGLVVGADWLQAVGLFLFATVGIGSAPWQGRPGISTSERLVLSVLTSVAVLTLVPVLMTSTHLWYPDIAFVAVAAMVLPAHVSVLVGLRASPAWRSAVRTRGVAPLRAAVGSLDLPLVGVAVVGAALCLVSAARHRHLEPGAYGFLVQIGPAWYAGLAVVLAAVCLLPGRSRSRGLAVVLLVVVLTLTPAICYDAPRSQSAAKHIAFVTEIQSTHRLDTSVPLYNAYAGFFAAMAWLCDLMGVRDPLRLATLWPALVGLARVAVLHHLAVRFLTRRDHVWTAVTLAVLADSLGTDYFSPQSVAFVIGLGAIAVSLSSGTSGRIRATMTLVAGCTLAVTHQLSPYVIAGILFVLAVYRVCRPWWTFLLVLAPAAGWAGLHFAAVREFVSFDSLGQPGNFRPPGTAAAPGLERLPVVEATVVALVTGILLVGLLAAVTLVRRRRDLRSWALATSPAVGLGLVATNPYGQEAIFRAALFGLPWLALLAAPTAARLGRIGYAGVVVVLAGAFLVSSFGLDGSNVIRRSDLAAVRYVEDAGGPRPPQLYYLLVLNPGDQPTVPEPARTRHFTWTRDIIGLPAEQEDPFNPAGEVRALTDGLLRATRAADDRAELYALWSPAGANFARYYGVRSLAQSRALRHAFAASPYWSVVRAGDGTALFRLDRSHLPAAAS